jgi:SnoaL-like domain
MTDHTQLATRYIAAWNETDPAARRDAVAALYTPDARYVDPVADVQGHDQIAGLIAAVQEQFPGFVFRLSSDVDAHHDQSRFTWDLAPAGAGGDAPVVGFDVVVTDGDGRIRAVHGFIDRMPAG